MSDMEPKYFGIVKHCLTRFQNWLFKSRGTIWGYIFFWERYFYQSFSSTEWKSVTFLQNKNLSIFVNSAFYVSRGRFQAVFFEKRLFSSFFDNQRKILWRKIFGRILKIAHLTAKRNPWFRINFVWKTFPSFSNLEQYVVEFWSKFLASMPLMNFTFSVKHFGAKAFIWKTITSSSFLDTAWKVCGFREKFFGAVLKIHSFCLREHFEAESRFSEDAFWPLTHNKPNSFSFFGGIFSTRLTKLPSSGRVVSFGKKFEF